MGQNLTNRPASLRRGAPLWVQILIWAGLLTLLIILGLGLFRAQNPIISIGSKVPDFTLKLFDGYQYKNENQVSLASLRGKVVVVNFWASWCITCADEAPGAITNPAVKWFSWGWIIQMWTRKHSISFPSSRLPIRTDRILERA
jgi:thiol:disulfide interchange protein